MSDREPQTTMGLLQRELEKKWRLEENLANEPLGPERPRTPAEYRAHFEAADLEAGDMLMLHDGVEATVEGIVPAYSSEFPDIEWLVHYRGTDPNPEVGEFQTALPAHFIGDDLFHGRIEVADTGSAPD